MKNSHSWPEKVVNSLLETHYSSTGEGSLNTEYRAPLYMVVNSKTGRPQRFSAWIEADGSLPADSLGSFVNASTKAADGNPAMIFDRETALFLIGQSAIADSLYSMDAEEEGNSDVLILLPVFGACIPDCLPAKVAK